MVLGGLHAFWQSVADRRQARQRLVDKVAALEQARLFGLQQGQRELEEAKWRAYLKGRDEGYLEGYHHGYQRGLSRGHEEGLQLLIDCEESDSARVAAK